MITGSRKDFDARCFERGYTFKEVMACIIRDDGDMLTVDETHAAYPRARAAETIQNTLETHGQLPGTELHALLRDWLGIEPTPECPCRSMAAKMDRLGPDWCESDEGMAEILGVMRTEHEKRRAEGTTILPWTDFGARQLVLLACRRARAKAAG